MLSDRERERLAEIERRLAADDPELARSLRGRLDRRTPGWRRPVYVVVIAVSALLATVLLLVGSPGGALAFVVVVATVGLAHHHESKDSADDRGDVS